MSTDCLCEYHGRASRDIQRVWSGWASTVTRIHGPRYEQDLGPRYAPGCGPRDELGLGPRYAPGRGPRYALGCGPRYVPDRGPRNCWTNLSATASLDLRASEPTAQILSMDIEAPHPWSPQPES
jgi:hypothetical protein